LMSGFGLVPVDGGDLVQLPPGETVLGRGPFLGISDTRVSRRHCLLENLDGELRLKPQTHINPCFLLLSPNDDPRPLERGSWHRLHLGDQFSLLPGRFIYRVAAAGAERSAPRNSQNFEDEEGALPLPAGSDAAAPPVVRLGLCPQRRQTSMVCRRPCSEVLTRRLDGVQSDEAPPPPRRRVLPAWMMAAVAAPASKGREDHKFQSSLVSLRKLYPSGYDPAGQQSKQGRNGLPHSLQPDTHWLFVHPGVKRSKPAATQAPPTLSSPPEGAELCEEEAERPRKKSRAMSSEEEILPTQTENDFPENERNNDPETMKLQDQPNSRSFRSRLRAHRLGRAGSEVSSAPSQSAAAEKSQQEEKKTRPGVRTACPYGKDCYRKNPLHFQESSHPGDADYEEEDDERPECPYGAACYRKNLVHRKQFRHPERPAWRMDAAGRFARDPIGSETQTPLCSFISDDSGDDSDYEPQDDLQRQREAKAFQRRR
uniref:PBZ-type domain-containing protein n=1 Tax=Poecilia formosa TaxID=48698 RepID=A0A096M440_POEFO